MSSMYALIGGRRSQLFKRSPPTTHRDARMMSSIATVKTREEMVSDCAGWFKNLIVLGSFGKLKELGAEGQDEWLLHTVELADTSQCLVIAVVSQAVPRVSEIYPRTGGRNGATRLTIRGEGFSGENQFDYGAGNEELGNQVQLVSETRSIPCDVERDSSHETQIVCYTRPLPIDSYYVVVSVDGVEVNKRFAYDVRDHYTPTIEEISPKSGLPGQLITIRGKIITDVYSSNEPLETNQKKTKILRVYAGGMLCDLLHPDSDTLYGVKLDHISHERGIITCKMTGSYVGHHNMSFILDNGYGRSLPDAEAYFVSSLNKLSMFQTYAEVTGIYPSEGSVEGGTRLTVNGRFFDETDAPARVTVADQNCEIRSVNTTQIICLIPKESNLSRTVFQGGRGLKVETWKNGNLRELPNYNESTVGYNTSWTEEAFYKTSTPWCPSVTRLSGFFIAPETDNYRFYIKGRGVFELYFSLTGLPQDKAKVAYGSWQYYLSSHRQASDTMRLEKGKGYYMEALLVENSASSFVSVGVYLENTSYTDQQTADSVNEYQRIYAFSHVVHEKQVVTLENWTIGNAINEVQKVTITSPCWDSGSCSFHWYRLTYNEEHTEFFPADASGKQIEQALNDLWSIRPDKVKVSSTAIGQGFAHTVTFISTRGNFDLLQHEVMGGSNISVEVVEQVQGRPSMDTFTLRLEGINSRPLPWAATVDEVHYSWLSALVFVCDILHCVLQLLQWMGMICWVKAALDELIGVKCPEHIAGYKNGYAVKYFNDFEESSYAYHSGQVTMETDAFCGRYSVKNPYYLFGYTQSHQPVLLNIYKQLCFAYKGILRDSILLLLSYKDKSQTITRHFWLEYRFAQENQWSYTCINLLSSAQAAYSTGTNFILKSIRLFKSSNQDYFVDTVYIGQHATTSNQKGAPVRTLPPLIARGIIIKQFIVTRNEALNDSSTNEYEITMVPFNCSFNIPLLEIGFAQLQSNVTKNEYTFRGITWPKGSLIRVRRIQAASPPITGTLDIEIFGRQLKGLPVSASALEMQYTLQSIPEIGSVSVQRSGRCSAYNWNVKWLKAGKQPILQVNGSNLQGADATVIVYSSKRGGLFRQRLIGDLFRTPHPLPQVHVFINGISSNCSGNCGYMWNSAKTPVITGISPSKGSALSGTVLTISGYQFANSSKTDTTWVLIGEANCPITGVTDTEITCLVGRGYTTVSPLTVYIAELGFAKHADNRVFTFTYELEVTSIFPSEGSTEGGTILTISGSSFTPDTAVLIGEKNCTLLTQFLFELTCRTPPATAGVANISVFTNETHKTLPFVFTYNEIKMPVIFQISPTESSVTGGAILTICGSDFGSRSGDSRVFIGNFECPIQEWWINNITCQLPSLPPGEYTVWTHAPTSCFMNASIEYVLRVIGMSPTLGSLNGGTTITISGAGFSPTLEDNAVELALGVGYSWNSSSLDILVGDTVHWIWESPPLLQGLRYRVFSVSKPSDVNYKGKGFISGDVGTSAGSFSYNFTSPGTFFYSSGLIDQKRKIFLQGVVHVRAMEESPLKLGVFVIGFEAEYAPGYLATVQPQQEHSDNCAAAIPTCTQTVNSTSYSEGFTFVLSPCYTPTISSITPSNGTLFDRLTIVGTGFSNVTCANEVRVGDRLCVVENNTESELLCRVDAEGEMEIGVAALVSVKVHNHGSAISTPLDEFSRRFVLLPHVDGVSPSLGSTTGRTRVTLTGSGFGQDPSAVQVWLAAVSCTVVSVNYTHVICDSSPSMETSGSVSIWVRGYPAVCRGSCGFTYNTSIAPVLQAVSPLTLLTVYTEITISGRGFGNSAELVFILVGNASFKPSIVSDSRLNTTVGPLPVGAHQLRVLISDKGISRNMLSVTTAASASLLPASGGVNGGTTLSITGNGFVQGETTVLVDGSPCSILTTTPGEVQCVTPPCGPGIVNVKITVHSTVYPLLEFTCNQTETPTILAISPTTGASGTRLTIVGQSLGLFAPEVSVSIDGILCHVTMANESCVECTVGHHAGGTYPIVLKHATRGYAEAAFLFQYQLNIISVFPTEGSFGGGLLLTVWGTGFDGERSRVFVCDGECKVEPSTSNSSSICCHLPLNNGTGPEQVCNVTVVNSEALSQLPSAFTYASALTPVVTGIEPRRGGTAGGTKLTITGAGFSANETSVTVAEAACEIRFVNDTYILCITGAQSPSQKTEVKVNVGGNGIAKLDFAHFYYVDVWSSRFTWGGLSPPERGSLVVITKGQTILLDQSTPVLKMLLIQGGALVFDEADIELQAENILITDGGLLQVGTNSTPFSHKAIITLHGHLRSRELPLYGSKTLAVREGTLDLHGLPIPVTWTHLAETAEEGASTIRLQKAVTWRAGDEIVIASTGGRHSQRESEQRTIEGVSTDGRMLNLTEPLRYRHLGTVLSLSGATLEARAEVGLLSRNVVVRGSINEEWSDIIERCPDGFDTGEFATQTCFQGRLGEEIGSDEYGGCIMFHSPRPDRGMVVGRIEYVEVYHAGQAFRLGRYPLHWHLLGDLSFQSYVRGCSIHRTFNRAVTIHGTHRLLVEGNVAFNIMGGAFFLEDGAERDNVLQHNLAVRVRRSTSLLNDDLRPAAFWVTHPGNTLRHNAAAGGTHFGFWYRLLQWPEGASSTRAFSPRTLPLGLFHNNSAHSLGWYGLWIFPVYQPREQSGRQPEPAAFSSFTAWSCGKGAEWTDGGAIQFHNFLLVGNEKSGAEAQRIQRAAVSGWGMALITNLTVVGHADGLGLPSGSCTQRGLVLPLDQGLIVQGLQLVNFDRPGCAALGLAGHFGGGWSVRFSQVRYHNTSNKAHFGWEHQVMLEDMDGSLAGGAGYKVLPYSRILDPAHCWQSANWSSGYPGVVCDSTVTFHRMVVQDASPYSLWWQQLIISNTHGFSALSSHDWLALVPNNQTINLHFKLVDHITEISYRATFYHFTESDHIVVSHNFTQHPDHVQVTDLHRNASLLPLDGAHNQNGDWYFDKDNMTLYYLGKIGSGVGQQSNACPRCRQAWWAGHRRRMQSQWDRADHTGDPRVEGLCPGFGGKGSPRWLSLDPTMVNVNIHLRVFRRFYQNTAPGSPPPETFNRSTSQYSLWSNSSFWESSPENNFMVPKEGDSVVVAKGVWLLIDIMIPSLYKLTIYGTLEVKDLNETSSSNSSSYMNIVLNATYISIQGGRFIAGTLEEPFRGELLIVLRGDHKTPDWPLPNGPNQGSKVLGVFGGLELHGIPHQLYRTKLGVTAPVGSLNLTLAAPVDWQEGDRILLTSTCRDAKQSESRTILSVSLDGRTLLLNQPLSFTHLVEMYEVNGGARRYSLAADVGLLSRNIRIVGHDHDNWQEQKFGARVLISSFFYNDFEVKGYARIKDVEFYHSGQMGYIDYFDPRYSVAFLNLGQVERNESYIQGCAIHSGFSPAIGVFGTDGLNIDDNIIYNTLGEGIKVWGSRNRVRRNLVVLSKSAVFQYSWTAAIEVDKGSDTVLQENIVVGSEQLGYRINGEPCPGRPNPIEPWTDNEVRGGRIGVYMNEGGPPNCSLIQGFTVWQCQDYGIYFQAEYSVQVSNVTLVDNGLGIFPMIYGPPALSHQMSNKTICITNALVVGVSPGFNCSDVQRDNSASNNINLWSRFPAAGRSGICWPTFASASNHPPLYTVLTSYPAISGLMMVQNTTFVGFRGVCFQKLNVMFISNPNNEDLQHPILLKGITVAQSEERGKVFIHRPNVNKVNPSDCVDMDCDGKKKTMLKDLDGSFLDRVGAVIPQSEYEWNGDKRRGLGDYRIPKVLLTSLNGSRIPVSQVAPHKGIIRDSSCTYMSDWQGYKCFGLNYELLVIESLDSDTEHRRLSPVAVLCDGYLDLINGPQDHGWCSGYSCMKRISLFFGIVATNKSCDVYFTSTSPQSLRLLLPAADANRAVRLSVYYSSPQRLDVYVHGTLIPPTNAQWNNDHTDYTLRAPTYTGEFVPMLNSPVSGANYFDRKYQMLNVLVRGSIPVEIHTAPTLFISFNLPAMTVDEFYGPDLARNLALFLDVPANKIRITKIIRETRRRKRRATGITVEVEIGEPPSEQLASTSSNSTNTSTPAGTLMFSDLKKIASNLGEAMLTGNLSASLGVVIANLDISSPLPSPDDPEWNEVASNPVQRESVNKNRVAPVAALVVVTQPIAGESGQLLRQQPCVMAVDTDGNCVSVGVTLWELDVALVDFQNEYVTGLNGTTRILFTGCLANFTDLSISINEWDVTALSIITVPKEGLHPLTWELMVDSAYHFLGLMKHE
ncbi:PKHD1 like 1, tandem duplicate 1 [Rhinoraja longicauda]